MALKVSNVFKLLAFFFCIGLFCWLMADIYETFSKNMTTVIVTKDEDMNDEKHLPCFTLCTWDSYIKPGFHYKLDDFKKTTYDLNDLVADLQNYQNEILIEELKSFYLGRCYMLCYKKPVIKFEMKNITFTRNVNLKGKFEVIIGGFYFGAKDKRKSDTSLAFQ